MLLFGATAGAPLVRLLAPYGLAVCHVPDGASIPGSYWGASEAGLRGNALHVRADTPVHSVLHEASHFICMSPARRAGLDRDAGGSDLEEAAVCYLQILLADTLAAVGAARLMRDMDAWGYSFRLGCTQRWFEEDAADARAWLAQQRIIDAAERLTGARRETPDPPPTHPDAAPQHPGE